MKSNPFIGSWELETKDPYNPLQLHKGLLTYSESRIMVTLIPLVGYSGTYEIDFKKNLIYHYKDDDFTIGKIKKGTLIRKFRFNKDYTKLVLTPLEMKGSLFWKRISSN